MALQPFEQRRDRSDINLQVDSPPEGLFQRPGEPVIIGIELLEHQLRAVQVKVGETPLRALIGNLEAQQRYLKRMRPHRQPPL